MKKMLILLSFVPSLAFGQYDINLELLAGGYNQPTDIVSSGDERLFVVEKSGKVKILYTDGVQLQTPFLDISTNVTSGNERGLLGLAFPPDYETVGNFYVNYTFTRNDSLFTRISRFGISPDDPDVALENTEESLLEFYQPFANHNGGQLEFGPDGYLYIASGDGGSGGDPNNNGQSKMTLLGKLLRIDVSTTPYSIPSDNPFVNDESGRDEIWAYGLRNPWKFAFDAETDDLYIADVGQGAMEEVNFQPAGAAGGANYGWRCYEGTQPYQSPPCPDSVVVTDPVFEYTHSDGCSVTGGRVYRGSAFPNIQGKYILTDFCSGNYWLLWQDNGVWQSFEGGFLSGQIVAFGEDMWGEMYAVNTSNGNIYRVQDVSGALVEGSVTWNSSCDDRVAVLDLYQPGTDILAYQYNVMINSAGHFQIDNVPLGTYDVFLTVNGFLTKTIGSHTITGNTELDFLMIYPGDMNANNAVSLEDLSFINPSFAKTEGDPEFNFLADLNCDGGVNILDISLLGISFGLEGDTPPLE